MNGTGEIEAIHVSDESAAETKGVEAIEAEALDAIEEEAGIALEPGAHRRNVTVRNAALNHLVGERFRVGEAVCEGVELCEPCSHLESLTEKGTLSALVHRGGLRASIVESGEIHVGDGIEQL
ncbi:sulfurase [Haladaptatus sp. W1]|uniref:MOSC domain-containing protein n=1 Tax=Haladaptatus sp. W1 TaxID=1897478 RepID=UPI000849AC32|nr:MOSC domain-containing protein [Haladaptatus sp. W1]ODR81524.1 sulfurase [Haladaptatus sp. W1]